MRISVVMATFNGEAFLEEQLESISRQTSLPTELVVGDDGSTDRTLAIVRSYTRLSSFPVRVVTPEARPPTRDVFSRVSANFSRALAAAWSPDVVILADQDDRWHADRIQSVRDEFDAAGRTHLLFCDARLIDVRGEPLPGSLRELYPVPEGLQHLPPAEQLLAVLRQPCVTGAASAFSAGLLDLAMPIPQGWLHDRWFSLMAAALGGLIPIERQLIDYRLHSTQVYGGGDSRDPGRGALLRRSAASPIVSLRRALALAARLRDSESVPTEVQQMMTPPGLLRRLLAGPSSSVADLR